MSGGAGSAVDASRPRLPTGLFACAAVLLVLLACGVAAMGALVIVVARDYLESFALEIWQGARLVLRLHRDELPS